MPEKPPGTFEICSICFWEDDGVQFADPDYRGGANALSLREAQENFREHGSGGVARKRSGGTRIRVTTIIQAPIERVFDAARDLDLHLRSMKRTGETAVAGRTSGLIGLGETVTWRARHFGVRQHFTSRIAEFKRPVYFQDAMVRGAFASFVHDHFFKESDDGTQMTDVVTFHSPLGPLGRMVDRWIMRRYMTGLIRERAAGIKEAAESRTTTAA